MSAQADELALNEQQHTNDSKELDASEVDAPTTNFNVDISNH